MVHAHGRAGRAGDRGRARAAASGSTPSAGARVYLDWLENIRPWCISRQLWWGHQLPVWYRGDETYVGIEPPRGRRLGARPRRARHVVLARRCGRSRRSAGPSETPELRAFYPTDVLVDGARHPLPVGRADDHDGARVHRRHPVRRRLHPLGHPGARRAADDASRSAPGSTRSTRSTRTAPTRVRFGLLAMSSLAGRALLAPRRSQQGQQLANKLWNASRLILLARRCRDARAAARPRDGRGPLDPLAPAARAEATVDAARRRASTSPTPRSALYDFVYGELCDWYLELVKPRLYDGRRRDARRRRCCTCCARRSRSRTR